MTNFLLVAGASACAPCPARRFFLGVFTIPTGTITAVRLDGMYGFIGRPSGDDVFFHANDLADGIEFDETLQELRVVFGIEERPKGPRARNVRPAD